MKQTNYMSIFLAPLCLLAGWWMASLRAPARGIVLALFVAGALPLLALERLVIESFVANSKGTLELARRHPDTSIYGLKNAQMAAQYYDAIFSRADLNGTPLIAPLDRAPGLSRDEAIPRGAKRESIAVVDLQTLGWGKDPIRSLSELPSCWQRIGQVDPEMSPFASATAGAVRAVLGVISGLARVTPPSIIRDLVEIKPAIIYAARSC